MSPRHHGITIAVTLVLFAFLSVLGGSAEARGEGHEGGEHGSGGFGDRGHMGGEHGGGVRVLVLLRQRPRVLPVRRRVSRGLDARRPTIVTVSRLRRLARDSWAIARPYWFSEDRWPALGLLVVVIALTLGLVYVNVL